MKDSIQLTHPIEGTITLAKYTDFSNNGSHKGYSEDLEQLFKERYKIVNETKS